MEILHTLIETVFSFGPLISYIALFTIIFAESGLFVGFFLPGDSLLFTAGFLASQGFLNIFILVVICFTAAVLGDSVGYAFGRRFGKRLFHKEDSFFFHKKNIVRAEKFYEKHGKKTIILARFIPVVRTFAPIVAGVGTMHYPTFLAYNIIGGVIWGIGIPVAGYFLGRLIPDVDRYLIPAVLLIVFISFIPAVYHILKEEESRRALQQRIVSLKRKIRRQRAEERVKN